MRPCSIAVVAACPFPVNYGSPGAIRELSATLSEMGIDVHIVTYPHGEDLSVGKAQLHRVAPDHEFRAPTAGPTGEKLYLDFLMFGKLCKTIWQEKVDIIHGHNYEGVLIGLFGKLVTRKPLIYQSVCLMADELASYRFIRPAFLSRWLGAFLDWFVLIWPDHIIAVTQELYDDHARRGVPKRKLSMITSGTDPAFFDHADPDRFRQKYGLGSNPVVMYTGITNHFQRIDYLIKAFSIVIKDVPSAILAIVNPIEDEPDMDAHRALVQELNIASNVLFLGPHTLAELPDYLAMATVTVAPRPECPGHPIKLLNYMISGKPIACFVGGAKGLTHMQDALVVPDHDWQALGEAISTLLRDPELAKKLGANARDNAINNFDWRVISKKVAAVYESIMNRAGQKRG
ncbi:MAG: glycosyltransferase family 4 protein [Verrucomicrobia bacterium]|nr:glycosyltransferase family 4 protein [Verrucomicrobiota bacterium]